MEREIPFGTFQPGKRAYLFLEIFQWNEPTKRFPFTAEPKFPEILTKWKAPYISLNDISEKAPELPAKHLIINPVAVAPSFDLARVA